LPPWSFHLIIYSSSFYLNNNDYFLEFIKDLFKKKLRKNNVTLWFLGPNPSFTLKNLYKYHSQLLIQSSSKEYLINFLNGVIDEIQSFSILKKVKWFIDVDPI